jgi:histidinol dehydrogenase
MEVLKFPDKNTWTGILKRPVMETAALFATVEKVIKKVRSEGDAAVREYTRLFDKSDIQELRVTEKEFEEAEQLVSPELKKAIALAIKNIETFHLSQQTGIRKVVTAPGVTCWQKSVAIDKVGLYIPGGTAPLFSTVLMLAVPARIAGCREIIMCSPPAGNGKIHPVILYAARLAGVTAVFRIGGAQAIGAMAYGTESVPGVYKIFGPGNQYVMAAKQLAARDTVAVDMPAGPSEVAVMADDTAIPAFVASDLLSQAEHGVDSQVLLLTTSEKLITEVNDELDKQLNVLPRKSIAEKALENSKAVLLHTIDDMLDMVNEYAPEHLIISVDGAEKVAEYVINAGSVFIGNFTPESAGDYASGTNHTLPTHGFAKAYNGVNLDSFVRKITFQQLTREGLRNIGPAVEIMAEAEGLQAHSNAISLRMKKD